MNFNKSLLSTLCCMLFSLSIYAQGDDQAKSDMIVWERGSRFYKGDQELNGKDVSNLLSDDLQLQSIFHHGMRQRSRGKILRIIGGVTLIAPIVASLGQSPNIETVILGGAVSAISFVVSNKGSRNIKNALYQYNGDDLGSIEKKTFIPYVVSIGSSANGVGLQVQF